MARHLLLWRMVNERIPVDPKERGAGWGALLNMVEKDLEQGVMKDWGAFPGEGRGYAVFEVSNLDLMKTTAQYNPFVVFVTHPVSTIIEAKEFISSLSG